MARRFLIVVLLVTSARIAGAQIIESGGRRSSEPNSWASLGIGWLQQHDLCDPESNACWDFGSAPQWRASLEYPVGRGATIGGAATTARVPLRYNGGGAAGCSSCDADATISQYMAQLHLGGGSAGIQQAIDISAGATVFTNFRTATGGTRLGPGKAVTNFSFALLYGFAFPISRSFQITLGQEYGLIVGKRMSGVSNNSAQQTTTRIGARVGLGL